jgi:PBSX family phage terminase large subunit
MTEINVKTNYTKRQKQALELVKQGASNILFYGGSRSGKTFFICDIIFTRAIMSPGSRHLIARLKFNAAKASVWLDTLKKVSSNYPGVECNFNESDHYVKFDNAAEIWLDGLDEKERVEKILGREYSTIFLNEVSQIPYTSVRMALTRLSQKSIGIRPRGFYDLNPTSRGHWSHRMFIDKVNPITGEPLKFPDNYAAIQMNPTDNRENLADGYIEHELESLTGGMRERFLLGNYSDFTDILVFQPPDVYAWDEFLAWGANRWHMVRLVAGLDIGFEDADAFAVLAYVENEPETWLVAEYKERRNLTSELATAIHAKLKWCKENIPAPTQELVIYTDTGGGGKKSATDLARTYGLPIRPAYKRQKEVGIELLQDDINAGRMHVMAGGIMADECTKIVWQIRSEDGQVIRVIDDKAYHPDLMDAVLYAHRYLTSYGHGAAQIGLTDRERLEALEAEGWPEFATDDDAKRVAMQNVLTTMQKRDMIDPNDELRVNEIIQSLQTDDTF